jgi:hypothetical protein
VSFPNIRTILGSSIWHTNNNGIVWVDTTSEELQEDGELTISIDTGNYSDPGIRSAIIKAAANSFMVSASGSNYWNQSWEEVDPVHRL